MRNAMLGWLVVALLLIAMSIGRAAEIDETVVTVQITSADHELEEGYFSLGANGPDGEARQRPVPVPVPAARPQGEDRPQRGRRAGIVTAGTVTSLAVTSQ